jgi:energy-coupling factor transporter ATP-binding protein EcfA2
MPWLLHSAAVVHGDRALLLVGPSGAGKSTLARALVLRGARYVSDEIAHVDAEGSVRGITRPIHLPGASGPADRTGDFEATDYAVRLEDGTTSRSRLLAPPARLLCHAPAALHGCVCLAPTPPGSVAVRRLPPGEALRELWPHSLQGNPTALSAAVAVVNRRPVWRLERGGVDETCAAIERLVD